jgi:hypothetical protein
MTICAAVRASDLALMQEGAADGPNAETDIAGGEDIEVELPH